MKMLKNIFNKKLKKLNKKVCPKIFKKFTNLIERSL
jgi:hypothetical protein